MSSDDFDVIAYKVLSYLYGCLKVGKRVDIAVMRSLAGCNEAYLGVVAKDLQVRGLASGFHFDGLSGVIVDSPALAVASDPTITMDGAAYVRDNSSMAKAKRFLGHAFDVALASAAEASVSLF